MIGRTYSIIRSSRPGRKTVETILETGHTWEVADRRRNVMTDEYRLLNPGKSSWSSDLFEVRMEGVEKGKGPK